MLSGDLTETAAAALADGEAGLRGIGFELFRPVLPMLASTAESVSDAVAGFETASVEWKLDGIRIQIHRRGDEVRIYTRNLNDITAALPGVVHCRPRPAARAGRARRRGALDGRRRPGAVPGDGPRASMAMHRPRASSTFLFDLLHLNGESLLDTPLRERAAQLDALAPDSPDSAGVDQRRGRGRAGAGRGARRRS